MGGYGIAKTASSVILGSMNDLSNMARWFREDHPRASLLDMALDLAGNPCAPNRRAMAGNGHAWALRPQSLVEQPPHLEPDAQ